MAVISKNEIPNYIPHRFENILIDTCYTVDSVIDDIVGSHEINLSEHDTDGRIYFLNKKKKSICCLHTSDCRNIGIIFYN